MPSFAQRFADISLHRSPLCLGLDPSEELFQHWGLANDASGLRTFCETVLEAADQLVAVIKPQIGFFERFGPEGMAELAATTRQIQSQGALCLIDAKRGDVSGTMKGYAAAMLGIGSGFGADAVTVNAYLGFEALRPVFDRAITSDTGVFVVVHSSNPHGRALQKARHPDGRTVSQALADNISAFNAALGPEVGVLGAVVGATIDPADTAIIDRLPQSLILAPGFGARAPKCRKSAPGSKPRLVESCLRCLALFYATAPAARRCGMR